MPQSSLRLIKRVVFDRPADDDEIKKIPRGLRGIYALYRREKPRVYKTVYVGMSATKRENRGGIRSRIWRYKKSGKDFTHFSAFEVWDNISDDEIAELEGLIRQIYKLDTAANELNEQRGFRRLKRAEKNFSLNRRKFPRPQNFGYNSRSRRSSSAG